MYKKLSIIFLALLSFMNNASSSGPIVIAVGEAEVETRMISFYSPSSSGVTAPLLKTYSNIVSIIKNDLSFYSDDFSVESKQAITGSSILSKDVAQLKLDGSSFAFILSQKGNETWFKFIDISTNKEIIFEKILTVNIKDERIVAHHISSMFFEKINSKPSIFKSKIFFVSDRNGTRRNPVKELYIMDFDGGNKKRLTHHKGTVISPAVSQDGTKVLYSLIPRSLKKRTIRLMLLDMKTGRSKIISNKKGINAGAIFSNNSNEIILTLSYQGNAELYRMNLLTKALTRITKHYSPDVDPSLSFDGTKLTFLSGRSGTAMIYTLDPSGREKSVKRISYVGKFNATPRFSPDGKTIVFSSWLDNRFDLFRLSSNGKELFRLTKDFGSNEDPTFSKDGQFISFSSLRVISRKKADQNIYIMNNEGKIWGKITSNFGNCITPRWSK